MSILAKTFTVLILIFSVAFLSISLALYQHSIDWRDKFEKIVDRHKAAVRFYEGEIGNLKSEITAKDSYIQTKEEESRTLRQHIDSVGRQLVEKDTSYNQQLQQNEKLLDDHGKVVEQLQDRQNRIALLERERDTAREEKSQAATDKEQAENQVARLLSIKNSLEKDLTELRKEYVVTRQSLSDKELILNQLEAQNIHVADIVAGEVVKPIPAEVLAVMDDIQPALVLLSVGGNEGVKTGYEFTIYRGNEFVARVVVEKVLPNRAGARVQFPLDARILPGDSANTILQ